MTDEIIKELWQIKDNIASEHNYDLDALVIHLRSTGGMAGRRVVDIQSSNVATEQGTSTNLPSRVATEDN